MTYKFSRNGVIEEVEKEAWQWEAQYTDGSILKQFADNGIFHQFQDIDQKKLSVFKMVADGKQPYILLFEPERMKLIHFYKRLRLNIGTDQEQFVTIYCFGYETKIHDLTRKMNMMIMPGGELIVTEDTNRVRL